MFCNSKAALKAITHGYSRLTQENPRLLEKIVKWRNKHKAVHVRIYGNGAADKLAKEARDINNTTISLVKLDDANAIHSPLWT